MQHAETSVFARDDTFFGVCEALGEDFGFNPVYLRIALGVLVLWNPVAVLGGYVAAGLLVGLSRWLVPNPRLAAVGPEIEPVGMAAAAEQALPDGDNDRASDLAVAA